MNYIATFQKLIDEVGVWSFDNFGLNTSKWHKHNKYLLKERPIVLDCAAPVLGIIEEVGELITAVYYKPELSQAQDAVADILIYLADYVYRMNPLTQAVFPTIDWNHINNRLKIESNGTHHPPASPVSLPERTGTFLLDKLGRLARINLKRHQGIRGWDKDGQFFPELSDLLAKILIGVGRLLSCGKYEYAIDNGIGLGFANVTVEEMLTLATNEWERVRRRNWKTSPSTGVSNV